MRDASLAEQAYGSPPGNFLATKYGRTHYMLQGPKDAPLILLLHGLSANVTSFDNIARELVGRGYRVLRFDFYDRGWSETSPLYYPIKKVGQHPLRFTIDLYVDQVDEVLWQLGLSKASFVVLGNSTGGGIGIALAARYPQCIIGLLLLAPACLPSHFSPTARLAGAPMIGPGIVARFGSDALYRNVCKMLHDPSHPWQVSDMRMLKCNLDTNRRFFAAIQSTLTNCRSLNHGDLLPEYETVCRSGIPTELIWGTLDTACPYANATRLLELAQAISAQTSVRLATFEGQPHVFFTPDAKERETLALIVDLLEEVCPMPRHANQNHSATRGADFVPETPEMVSLEA
jgi:pimeloyl-ACP methyl ester carboxylesterase